jgi:hypothetical protein
MTTAFVLGGGGLLGAHEVGMLRALSEAGIRPDLVVGTSVGAINGAFIAADPAGSAAPADPDVAGRSTAACVQREAMGPGGPSRSAPWHPETGTCRAR